MTDAAAFNEVATAIMQMRHTFLRNGMEPAIIELSSRYDGERLRLMGRAYINETGGSTVAMAGGIASPVNQIEIAGTIVRWPAVSMAYPGGMKFV